PIPKVLHSRAEREHFTAVTIRRELHAIHRIVLSLTVVIPDATNSPIPQNPARGEVKMELLARAIISPWIRLIEVIHELRIDRRPVRVDIAHSKDGLNFPVISADIEQTSLVINAGRG